MTALSTSIRALHLVSNAAWFGGSLMGAVGFNPAARAVTTERDSAVVSSTGWERWGPVQGTAIAAHLLSGMAIIGDNRRRVALHPPTSAAVAAKTALTGVALAATAAAWDQGDKLGDILMGGPPRAETGAGPATLRRRLARLQWVVPAATGGLLVLDAYLGEQQRGVAGLLDEPA